MPGKAASKGKVNLTIGNGGGTPSRQWWLLRCDDFHIKRYRYK